MKKINESGFTLIELLGTIVIIGILGTIAVTSVVNIKKSSNIRFDNSQVELMKQAGQTYFTDNKRLLPIVEGQTNYVTLDKLIEKGYINKLYNSKKEEFDPTTSYAWVQKQNDGSYKYDCYCEIKGEKLAGTTAIPESKENNSIVTFEYENFYNNKSANKYYTNGKNNSIVKIHLNRNEVSEYRYEIYKKDTKNENSQYKISQREKLTTNLVNIKLNAKDYSDGEYFIKVTTYNSTGNSKQSSSSAKIYVDKTPPTCNITTTYQKDSNSAQKLWYSSKSKNNNNQELGVNSKLPISIDGSDKGSGIKLGSKHIFSDSEYTKQINNETGTYEAENTGKNGKEYYATVEDNVGNKATCSQIYYIDTTPPTCSSKGIEKGNKGNKVQDKQWYLGDVTTYGYFTDENSGVTTEKQLGRKLTKTSKEAQISTITQKDNAGNEGKCVINDIYIDKEKPTCISSGGSNTWKNAASDRKTTLKGTCNDVGSGCVAGSNLERIYDNNGNIYLDITWEGSWTNLSPGTVYDEAGNSTECPGNQTVKHDWTAPTCSISLSDSNKGNNVGGRQWYRGDVTASLSITDDTTGPTGTVKSEVTPKIDNQTLMKVTKTNNGEYTISGKVTDAAGNSTTCQSANFGIDKTKPDCQTTGNSDNWVNTDVTLTGTCSDSGSGCSDDTKTITKTIDNETNADYTPGSVSDKAGNSKTCNKVRVKIDKTAPTCNPGGYTENWYNGHLTLTGTCVDSTSGCNPSNSNVSFPITTEIQNSNFNFGQITDNAGNVGYCSAPVYTDYTAPTCPTITSSTKNENWTKDTVNIGITNTNQDNLSGVNYWKWYTDYNDGNWNEKSTNNGDGTKTLEAEGKRRGLVAIYDHAGNHSDCMTLTYYIDKTAPTITGTCLFNQTGSNGLYPKGFWCQEPGSSIEHVYHGGWIYVQDNYVNVGSISNLKVSSGSLTRNSRTGNASGNRFCISTGTDTSGANVTLSGNFCDSLGNCQDLSTTLSNHIGTGFPNYNNKCSGNADSNGDPICDCKYLRTDHKWTG